MTAGPRPKPSTAAERALWPDFGYVAGVDEVGRGPLAGPIFAAAVILNPQKRPRWLRDLRDSKVLTAPERERLAKAVRDEVPAYGIGYASVAEIDAWGITTANRMAMVRAISVLPVRPRYVLIDGPNKLPAFPLPQRAIVDGDASCCSIAAASIVAKVARDEVMCRLDSLHPEYGFASHKGYATREHMQQIARHGTCVQHRRTWLSVQKLGLETELPDEDAAG
jgi:ribonuclease HII